MPSFRLRPTLISAWSNRVLSDAFAAAAWPGHIFVIQPNSSSRFQKAFFPALASGDVRVARDHAVLGRSILANLHPVAIGALSRLTRSNDGCLFASKGESNAVNMIHHFAEWLKTVTRESSPDGLANQLPYLFASGAQRARIIATVLDRSPPAKIERLVDIGTAAGIIPWLLQYDLPALQAATLIEPLKRFHPSLGALWRNGRCARNYTAIQSTAEQAEYGNADLVMFSHCLYLIAREKRQTVLLRAWDALNPGGILLVNETFTDGSIFNPERPDLIHRNELLDIVPGAEHIFTRQSNWRTPQILPSVTARVAGHTSVIFAMKGRP